jgi:hypothetical protein
VKNLILFLAVLAVLGVVGYRLFNMFAKEPSAKTVKTAQTIEKYPTARTWSFRKIRNLCVFATDECNQPVKIVFTTKESWGPVYNYFKEYLALKGWITKSIVFTSVPDGAVYHNNDDCEAYVTKESTGFFGVAKSDSGKFSITVTCR